MRRRQLGLRPEEHVDRVVLSSKWTSRTIREGARGDRASGRRPQSTSPGRWPSPRGLGRWNTGVGGYSSCDRRRSTPGAVFRAYGRCVMTIIVDDAEATPVGAARQSPTFSWSVVPPEVIRRLLLAEYHRGGNGDHHRDIEELHRLSDVGLARQAKLVFGRPPKPVLLEPHVGVLVKHWLPIADESVVAELVVLVQASLAPAERNRTFRSHGGRVRFLQERQHTKAFKDKVRKAFISANKVQRTVHVRPTARVVPSGPVDLKGEGAAPPHHLYEHQRRAHDDLNRLMRKRAGGRRGLVVLPTGAGKTDTLVSWLVPQLASDPQLRVLWIAHRQELLEQAVGRFASWGAAMPQGVSRRVRIVHSRAAALSTLSKADVDIGLVTFASLANNWSATQRRVLDKLLERPTILVVDEAHHAGAKTYCLPLEYAQRTGVHATLGLTATPNPLGSDARRRVRKLLGSPIIEVPVEHLIAEGVLARPVVHTVDTGEEVELDRDELAQSEELDVPPAVLRRLAYRQRNELVVETIASALDDWGKSLVFAVSIEHAERLADMLRGRLGPDAVRAVHSLMDDDRSAALAWFRRATSPVILVSVGMLTEGVDLPDARTAFLARPTTSHILLRQMVGRVLRGPASGGTAEGHVVFFRDEWTNFADILEPAEVLRDPEVRSSRRATGSERRLPPVEADDGSEIPADVVAAIERMYRSAGAVGARSNVDSEHPRTLDVTLVTVRLAGYYDIGDRCIPVFDHQIDAYNDVIDAAVGGSLQGSPPLSFFDQGFPPYPTARSLRDLVVAVRENEEKPPWVSIDASIGPTLASERLRTIGPLTESARAALLQELYETSLARVAYPTQHQFEEAVERELRRVRQREANQRPAGIDAEHPIPISKHKRLRPPASRNLQVIFDRVHDRAPDLLPPHVRLRLGNPPDVKWTDHVVSSTFAHWSIRLQGRNAGKQVIRVNSLLRTTPKVVSDDMLAYLLWHELLHHLLPGQGHDSEFRELEARWPDAVTLDAEFHTFHERWETRPERYLYGE